MGCDLCLAFVRMRPVKGSACKKMVAAAKRYNFTEDSLCEFLSYGHDYDEKTPEEWREFIIKIIIEFFDSLDRRDSTYYCIYGEKIYISGGMSSGDSPTDGYDLFGYINALPQEILAAGGIYEENEDVCDLFFRTYKDKLPKTLKEEIIAWRMAMDL